MLPGGWEQRVAELRSKHSDIDFLIACGMPAGDPPQNSWRRAIPCTQRWYAVRFPMSGVVVQRQGASPVAATNPTANFVRFCCRAKFSGFSDTLGGNFDLFLFHKLRYADTTCRKSLHALLLRQALFVVVAHPSSISSPENSADWPAPSPLRHPSTACIQRPARCRSVHCLLSYSPPVQLHQEALDFLSLLR